MGKKRVTCDYNSDDDAFVPEPDHPAHPDHPDHHHYLRQKREKSIIPESKHLNTLGCHLKKIAKPRYRKNSLPLRAPTHANLPRESNTNTHNNGNHSLWLKHDHWGHWDDSSKGFDSNKNNVHHEDKGDDTSVFQFNQCWNTTSFIGAENNIDLFSMFAPDLNASGINVIMSKRLGLRWYAPYFPDPVTNLDNSDEGSRYLCDMSKLSSQEDMINEFAKDNLF